MFVELTLVAAGSSAASATDEMKRAVPEAQFPSLSCFRIAFQPQTPGALRVSVCWLPSAAGS